MSDETRPILKLHKIDSPIIKNPEKRSNSIEQLNTHLSN